MLSYGDYVVYSTTEICKLDGTEKRCFSGDEMEYYRLIPKGTKNSVYYVPLNILEKKVRKLISKEEIYSVIDRIPQIEKIWDNNSARRKEIFSEYLKSGDYEKIFSVAKSVYSERLKRYASGKRLPLNDENAIKTAENLISQEFSIVLGIPPESVNSFISERLNG